MIAQKTFILDYSLWFIGGPTLTVSVPDDGGRRGLFAAEGKTPRFYGTSSSSGGQNPAKPAAKIVVKQGSTLSACFVTEDDADISPSGGDITVRNGGNNGLPIAFTGGSGRAYFNWQIDR
jgi:hypothetical protein